MSSFHFCFHWLIDWLDVYVMKILINCWLIFCLEIYHIRSSDSDRTLQLLILFILWRCFQSSLDFVNELSLPSTISFHQQLNLFIVLAQASPRQRWFFCKLSKCFFFRVQTKLCKNNVCSFVHLHNQIEMLSSKSINRSTDQDSHTRWPVGYSP